MKKSVERTRTIVLPVDSDLFRLLRDSRSASQRTDLQSTLRGEGVITRSRSLGGIDNAVHSHVGQELSMFDGRTMKLVAACWSCRAARAGAEPAGVGQDRHLKPQYRVLHVLSFAPTGGADRVRDTVVTNTRDASNTPSSPPGRPREGSDAANPTDRPLLHRGREPGDTLKVHRDKGHGEPRLGLGRGPALLRRASPSTRR